LPGSVPSAWWTTRDAAISAAPQTGFSFGGAYTYVTSASISSLPSRSANPGICVAMRPRAIVSAAAGRRNRSRFSGSSAGPVPPSRSGPWQAAQCAA